MEQFMPLVMKDRLTFLDQLKTVVNGNIFDDCGEVKLVLLLT